MKRSEEKLHRELVKLLRATLPKPWLVFHIPNGGGRSKAEAGALKAMGTMAGLPDLLVMGPAETLVGPPHKTTRPHIIGLELKAPPAMLQSGKPSRAKPRVSDAQRDAIEALEQVGIPTFVVRSIDEAVDVLRKQGVPLKGRVM